MRRVVVRANQLAEALPVAPCPLKTEVADRSSHPEVWREKQESSRVCEPTKRKGSSSTRLIIFIRFSESPRKHLRKRGPHPRSGCQEVTIEPLPPQDGEIESFPREQRFPTLSE